MQARRLSLILSAIAVLCVLTTVHAAAAPQTIFVVDSVGNGHDQHGDDHVCDDGTGHCTLTAALDQADSDGVSVTINFGIPGGGVQTIVNGGGGASYPVFIDGTTQPGYAGTPLIVLSGGGIQVEGNSTVRGLALTNSVSFALGVSGGNNVITGNYIGTDATGTMARPNLGGIDVVAASNTTIQGNLVSGNSDVGIQITSNSTGTLVEGNLIGTDVLGTHALGNFNGIKITNANNNTIGGTTFAAHNVISGNKNDAIETTVNSTGNLIEGNYIGVDMTGKHALANGANGVHLNSSGNTVGGSSVGAGNRIEYNRGTGVLVTDSIFGHSIHNAILGNTIYANLSRGVNLGGNDVVPNDPGDADVGPNDLQNFPVVKSATSATKVIAGKLSSTPGTTFTLEFFNNKVCDSSHYGEGKTLLGEKVVTTNSNGVAKFSFTAGKKFKAGAAVTATATSPQGDTSEFSKCRTAI